MGRWSTYPTTVEDCLTLSLKDLRKWGYLKPNSFLSGTVRVTRGKRERTSYRISVCTFEGDEKITFHYTIKRRNGKQKTIHHTVPMVRYPANIGNGYRYYFLCPRTGKRCFKLYSPPNEDLFLHRDAFPYLIYEKQKRSKADQAFDNGFLGTAIKLEKLEQSLLLDRPKYAKYHYAGKPTKKVRKYLALRDRFISFSEEDKKLNQILA